MHRLKNITYSESFVPAGGPANETYKGEASCQSSDPMTYGVCCLPPALTVDAGVQWYEAYDAAQLANRTIVGGACGTVGAAGGWVMGGGHSALSPRHGLGTVCYLILVYHSLTHNYRCGQRHPIHGGDS
jgi:hypothetical protein